MVQENLRTSDRAVAAHLALERKVHWKREFGLTLGTAFPRNPRATYLETARQVQWIESHYRDPDDRDIQLDLLWDSVAGPEAKRLGYDDISLAPAEQVAPEVDAALTAIKTAKTGGPIPDRFKTAFSELAARFNEDRQRDSRGRLSEQTLSQREAVYRLVRDHVQDRPLAIVDARMASEFLDRIKRLAPNWGRSPKTKGRSLVDVLALSTSVKGERISNRTLMRYVSDLSQLWDWAERHGEVEGKNPFAGHWVEARTRKGANEPWSTEALAVLLTGYRQRGSKGEPDPVYWLPRIALLSGMRLNEICSLETSDIRSAEGVAYFDVTAGKTESSVRVVPIHSALQPFLELTPTSGHLFPQLASSRLDGKRSAGIGKVLGRSFKKIAGGSTFHAFRKNVAETFERERVPESEAAQILGHKKSGMTYGVYSPNGLRIGQKRGLIELLSLQY